MITIKSIMLGLGLGLLVVWAAGCGLPARAGAPDGASVAPSGPAVSHSGPVTDYVSVVDALRARGTTVEPAGAVQQPFFAVEGQVIRVNGQEVQVFEFADAAAADAAAAMISPDGRSTSTTMITWVAPPHFFKREQVVVLYVGDNAGTLQTLEAVLGPPFAGQ